MTLKDPDQAPPICIKGTRLYSSLINTMHYQYNKSPILRTSDDRETYVCSHDLLFVRKDSLKNQHLILNLNSSMFLRYTGEQRQILGH